MIEIVEAGTVEVVEITVEGGTVFRIAAAGDALLVSNVTARKAATLAEHAAAPQSLAVVPRGVDLIRIESRP